MNGIAIRALRQARTREIQRSQGQQPQIMRSSASAAADISIADSTRMPVKGSTAQMQDGSGHFYFVVGFSQIGGTDIVR